MFLGCLDIFVESIDMQEVAIYYDVIDTAKNMRKRIEAGWRVHTCAMSSCKIGTNAFSKEEKILVIYEK